MGGATVTEGGSVMSVRGDATAARYGFHLERSPFGGFTLYEARGAGYLSRRFLFCTVLEACQAWRRELRGGAA